MTTINAMILAGTPLVKKCLTLKYLCPASFSIMIAAVTRLISTQFHMRSRHDKV